jgi:hypothetical protein
MLKPILKQVRVRILIMLAIAFLFLQPVTLLAETDSCSDTGYVVKFENGIVNWSSGCITAKGKAAPQKEDKNKSSSSIPGAANTDAMKNLLSILKDIKIAQKSVKEFVASNDDIMAQIENSISDVSLVKQHYTSDGALEIEVQISMYGGFLQLILPHEIAQIPEIQSVEALDKIQTQRGKYTGLVVDARGLEFEPMLYPVIKNEYGGEIYSGVFINRDSAVQQGVCEYFCDMEKAVSNKRVGKNPLVLKGLRTGEDKTSIILNKSDAEKIEKVIERHAFFKECRVIIVLN